MQATFDYTPKFELPVLKWDWDHPFYYLTMPEMIVDYAQDIEGQTAHNDNSKLVPKKPIYGKKRKLFVVDNNRKETLLDRILN